ncbi:RNA-directed DNA polymerase, eukaryota [Artemisia annua]|uniref:RNA-directed DNA polymerase, eukaryota n=1 Tax=Artemisia annua TaxID=35608 RepID=A0A2U1PMJ3_ARTAN|nr:RNA-directed DNA polymerase, eukaryota [Artemisia annua]
MDSENIKAPEKTRLPRFTTTARPNFNSNNNYEFHKNKSYASVAQGVISTSEVRKKDVLNVKSVQLGECELIKVEDTSTVVLVKVKEIDTMSNMYHLCRNEGFADVKIHYVGGLWLWLQFTSVKSCSSFKSNDSLKKLWTCIKDVSPSFIVDERMIWIEISAYLYVLGDLALSKKWQTFLVDVTIHGETFQVQVKEIGAWSINIPNYTESNDSDDEYVSSNGIEAPNKALDEFIQQVVEEKEVVKTTTEEPKSEDNKPINNEDSTSQTGKEDVAFSIDHVEKEQRCTLEDKSSDEVTSDISKPPGFENFVKENKDCHHSSNTSRAGKCSTSFAKYSRKELKGFSFIDEMNRMIEVGGALGYNVKGCKKSLRHLINCIVQETKMSKLELFQLRSMWGNFKFDYACSMARGRSGGLVTMWDPNVFVKKRLWCGDNYVIVEGKWNNSIEDFYFINVYGPQHQPDKSNLWSFLRMFIQDHFGRVILFGDLNEVRSESERFGSIFSCGDASLFNSFIHSTGLIDLTMGGRNFT